MSRTIEAEYLAETNVLKLAEPLAGVRDHGKVRVTIEESVSADRGDWPTLSDEAGHELAQAVSEAFGRDLAV
jgi:hypothetical protein